jgi:hypothetical protein
MAVIAIGMATLLIGGAIWILLLLLPGRAARGDMAELGTMSQQWRIELRASDQHDSER